MDDLILENKIQHIIPVVRKYPVSVQRPLLKYLILYVLRNNDKEEIISQCAALLSHVSIGDDRADTSLDQVAAEIGLSFNPEQTEREKINEILGALQSLKRELKLSLSTTPDSNLSINEVVDQLVDREFRVNTAMHDAARMLFDRIYGSFDPGKAKNYLDQSVTREGVELKAALYDATCEKYEQLLDYHQNGRLLKDFRGAYKSELKKINMSDKR